MFYHQLLLKSRICRFVGDEMRTQVYDVNTLLFMYLGTALCRNSFPPPLAVSIIRRSLSLTLSIHGVNRWRLASDLASARCTEPL